MRGLTPAGAYRLAVLVLWSLATWNSLACRALFWDGASFLVSILDLGAFHDFYGARAHVDWLTQLPVLALARLGVRDTHLLSIVYSATLFAVPTALYHVALSRVRRDPVELGVVIAVVAVVFLPTWFFIIGEYNVTFAATTAAMAIVVTMRRKPLADAVVLCLLGVLVVRSYEAMIYLGPLLAAALFWVRRRQRDGGVRLLLAIAALAFLAAAVVAGATIVDYWDHPHFVKVRSTAGDFWQNLQFAVPFVALAVCVVVGLLRPRWLAGRGPRLVLAAAAATLAVSPWVRFVNADSILYPPAHYLARQAAGLLLAAMLAALWWHAAGLKNPPAVLVVLREPAVARGFVRSMAVLLLAGAVPDLVLTGQWRGYLDRLRLVVDGGDGLVRAETLPLRQWPDKLFAQDWTLPALSAVVSRTPGRAYVRFDNDFLSNPPFDPACGTLPRLRGYGWKG